MNKKYTVAIVGSIFIFISMIILNKTVGYTHVANLYPTTPLEWSEIFDNLPRYGIASIVFGIFIYILLSQIEKDKQKNKKK